MVSCNYLCLFWRGHCLKFFTPYKHLVNTVTTVKRQGLCLKGALYGIEPSTRNGQIWPTREEAAPSVPKNILLTDDVPQPSGADTTATTDKTSVPCDNCCCYF